MEKHLELQLLNQFKTKVEQAELKYLMLSRKNCHAKNLSSIVFDETCYGGLSRAFLAFPNHGLEENNLEGKLNVGIHNHRYNLEFSGICGRVKHTVYNHSDFGRELNHWKFTTGKMVAKPKLEYVGKAKIAAQSTQVLSPYFQMFFGAKLLHDIDCWGMGAWYVEEFETVMETTDLFTFADVVNTDGLYDRFESREEVLSHVDDFIELYTNEL